MSSGRKKRPNGLEMSVTWMLGCLVLLISNGTIFKSFNASVGEPWLNLLLSAVILVLLGRIAVAFYGLQRDVKVSNSGISRVDEMDDEQFAGFMLQNYRRLGWMAEAWPTGRPGGACLELRKGRRRVLALCQTGRRKLTKEYVTAAHSLLGAGREGKGGPEIWLVTNASYTAQASREASSRRIRLVDRAALIDILVKAGGGTEAAAAKSGTGIAE